MTSTTIAELPWGWGIWWSWVSVLNLILFSKSVSLSFSEESPAENSMPFILTVLLPMLMEPLPFTVVFAASKLSTAARTFPTLRTRFLNSESIRVWRYC